MLVAISFMRVSERIRKGALAMIAVSPIFRRFSLPGIVGIACIFVGVWQEVTWLTVTGMILAAPVIWAYAVLMCVYFPWLLFDSIRRSFRGNDRA